MAAQTFLTSSIMFNSVGKVGQWNKFNGRAQFVANKLCAYYIYIG